VCHFNATSQVLSNEEEINHDIRQLIMHTIVFLCGPHVWDGMSKYVLGLTMDQDVNTQ
jgi:hypothetical protein